MTRIDITRPLARAASFLFAFGLGIAGFVSAPAEVRAQGPRGVIAGVDDVVDPIILPAFEVEYVVEINNFSSEPMDGIVIRAETPAGTYFGEANATLGAIEAPAQGARGPMVLRVPTLGPGGAVSIRYELGLTAPAGSRIDFTAEVAAESGQQFELVETTFVINSGEPVLKWEPEAKGPAASAPQILRVERPTERFIRPNVIVEPFIEGLEYRIYRSADATANPETAELVATLPGSQRNTGALTGPGFYFVTAVLNGVESDASNVVSLGLGEPVVDQVKIKTGVLKAKGSNFDQSVVVTVDGLTFKKPAAVNAIGTKVTQTGKLSNGQSLNRYVGNKSDVAVCFRNANGSVSCFRYTTLAFVP
jgi:hypothetical protein